MFLWLTGQGTEFLPGRSPGEYAQTIAADLATTLAEHPDLDIDAHLNDSYTTTYRAFVVVTRDGRTASSRRVRPPLRAVACSVRSSHGPRAGWRPGRTGRRPRPGPGPFGRGDNRPPDGPPPDGRPPDVRPERGRLRSRRRRIGRQMVRAAAGAARAAEDAAVRRSWRCSRQSSINERVVAMVAVPSDPPPLSVLLRDFGPTLGIVAVCLLIVGHVHGRAAHLQAHA